MCGFMGPMEPGLLTDTQLYSKSRSLGLGMRLSGRCIHLVWHLTLMTITKNKQWNKSRPRSKTTGKSFLLFASFQISNTFPWLWKSTTRISTRCPWGKLPHCDLQFKIVCECRMKIQTRNYMQTQHSRHLSFLPVKNPNNSFPILLWWLMSAINLAGFTMVRRHIREHVCEDLFKGI